MTLSLPRLSTIPNCLPSDLSITHFIEKVKISIKCIRAIQLSVVDHFYPKSRDSESTSTVEGRDLEIRPTRELNASIKCIARNDSRTENYINSTKTSFARKSPREVRQRCVAVRSSSCKSIHFLRILPNATSMSSPKRS